MQLSVGFGLATQQPNPERTGENSLRHVEHPKPETSLQHQPPIHHQRPTSGMLGQGQMGMLLRNHACIGPAMQHLPSETPGSLDEINVSGSRSRKRWT